MLCVRLDRVLVMVDSGELARTFRRATSVLTICQGSVYPSPPYKRQGHTLAISIVHSVAYLCLFVGYRLHCASTRREHSIYPQTLSDNINGLLTVPGMKILTFPIKDPWGLFRNGLRSEQ